MGKRSTQDDEVVEVARARRFELVDDQGVVIAVLGALRGSEGEGASLMLYDESGRERVGIIAFEHGGDIAVMRADGSIAARVTDEGFTVVDPMGRARLGAA